ncbi:membrane protein [Legionella quinlivanii]|uniref:Membrane protein n=1 Tax=Legionella quinlivanii TaxID=45073 RepID=A0A0W0Y0E1_9GAMM|nr:hypothetical protein [Legionella quinlivanii]KTD50176.1 membrane protein [Legionella quinlivanii]SEF48623.1 hypothetical protein SAMN02746093_00336 [Legionella quinlivanii DSM 21216]STY11774.1 membrane protein [Legionella quinlivanii]
MKISGRLLQKAVEAKIIDENQANRLLEFIKIESAHEPHFDFTNVLYYLGGLIAIGAMTIFMNVSWEHYGGMGIFYVSLLYAVVGLGLAHMLAQKEFPIPAGICATFVVALTPLAIYGLQKGMGWWPDDSVYNEFHDRIQWHWIYMEAGTLIVGIIMAWLYRYPFMIMPIAVTLWYLSMDVAALIVDPHSMDFEFRAIISMYFGLVIVLIAFWVDVRSRHSADYAFWLYIFGVIAFWGGLTCQSSDSELSKFFYLCINLVMIIIGVVLNRKVFVIFGGIGVAFYLGHLASNVFKDSLGFPAALACIGLLIIYLGTLWHKNEDKLRIKLQSLLPKPLQELLQARDCG